MNREKKHTSTACIYNTCGNVKSGFIALTLVVTVSSLLLAFSFTQSIDIGHFFDQTRLKEYRLISYFNAYKCIDHAILIISHDYFYETSTPSKITDLQCSIDRVYRYGDFFYIETHGLYKNIIVKRKAVAQVFDSKIEIYSID